MVTPSVWKPPTNRLHYLGRAKKLTIRDNNSTENIKCAVKKRMSPPGNVIQKDYILPGKGNGEMSSPVRT